MTAFTPLHVKGNGIDASWDDSVLQQAGIGAGAALGASKLVEMGWGPVTDAVSSARTAWNRYSVSGRA